MITKQKRTRPTRPPVVLMLPVVVVAGIDRLHCEATRGPVVAVSRIDSVLPDSKTGQTSNLDRLFFLP